MAYTETYTAEIELPEREELLTVELTGELELENDGIGSYEYWGAQCYDEGTDYFSLNSLDWDAKEFTEEENKAIKEYIDDSDNWRAIEERMSEKLFENLEPDEPDYEPDYDDRDYDAEFGGVDW